MEGPPTFCEASPLPLHLLLSVSSCTYPGLAFPLPPSPFPFVGLPSPPASIAVLLPPPPPTTLPSPPPSPLMMSSGEGEFASEFLAEFNGQKFKYNDLVDVIVGTAHGVVGKKCEPLKARFKGVVETERGPEFLCRPLVGSSRGRCPQYPRHSVFKLCAFGACVLGSRETRYFSKLKPVMQERFTLKPPQPAPCLSYRGCLFSSIPFFIYFSFICCVKGYA